jgi:zinc transporter 2
MYKLLMVTGISFLFMIAEIVGGYISGSLAIITDAAHMLSDVAGFLISYFAIYMGSRPANYQMSFGYHRAEILGALASIMLIWGIIVYLFIEAIHRIIDPEIIDGEIMLITACVGLVCNIISIFTLHSCGGEHGHHHHHHHGHSHGDEKQDALEEQEHRLSHCHQPALSGSKKKKNKAAAEKKLTAMIPKEDEQKLADLEKSKPTEEDGQ